MRLVYALLASLVLPISALATPGSAEHDYEAGFLKEHGIKSEFPHLIAFLKDRTLDDEKIGRIRELIKQMGNPKFAVRDRAAKDLLKFGISVLRFLEEARKDTDPEVADRAGRMIEQIKDGPGSSLPITVLRQLSRILTPSVNCSIGGSLPAGMSWSFQFTVRLRSERDEQTSQAVAALLGFAPFADDTSVEDEVLRVLAAIALTNGQIDPKVREFTKDVFPARRAAAGFLLGRSRADADVQAAVKLLTDGSPWVRLRTAQGLILGNQREGVPALIKLVDPELDEITWRAEDMLRRIARDDSPMPPTDAKAESRKDYVAAWDQWWTKHGQTVALALGEDPPLLGLWLGIEYNTNSVWECTRDGKRLWTVSAEGPMDAQVLPGNRVLIAEQSAKRVTERDFKGNIIWNYGTNEETLNCRRLPNGNTWIGTRHTIMEIRPNKTVVYSHRMSDQYMHAVRRLPNGNSVGITSGGTVREMTAAGKMVRTIQLAAEGTWGDVDFLPNGNYLVSNYGVGYIREVDHGGKTIRELKSSEATGVERQPNGQLLVGGPGKARLVDWTGRDSWSTTSNGYVRRIHLR